GQTSMNVTHEYRRALPSVLLGDGREGGRVRAGTIGTGRTAGTVRSAASARRLEDTPHAIGGAVFTSFGKSHAATLP
ncbi:hypothetical protein, partial [Nonomuraea sp. NPDC003201]